LSYKDGMEKQSSEKIKKVELPKNVQMVVDIAKIVSELNTKVSPDLIFRAAVVAYLELSELK
jgi:hypothetical protein